jgi:hypothetical protein
MSALRPGVYRVTYPAVTESGGTKRTTVMLRNPTVRPGNMPETEVISGREVDARTQENTDRLQVILTAPDEAKIVRLVQDLVTERYVTPDRESEASREMRRS